MTPRKHYIVPLTDGRSLELGRRTLVMGILNVTPDSFAGPDGGMLDPGRATDHALEMAASGADILDIGGESTRPGAQALPADDELARVVPVLRRLRDQVTVPISIDTYKADVARRALDEGAVLVNDVSGLRYDAGLAAVVAAAHAAIVLMHTRGRSSDMYSLARYDDATAEVRAELAASVQVALDGGIPRDRLILDPGLGFAKRQEHTFDVLAHLPALTALDLPLLVGPSRKSFLRMAIGDVPPSQRDWGTAAAVTAAVLFGAHIVRVHSVPAMVDVVRVADAIRAADRSE